MMNEHERHVYLIIKTNANLDSVGICGKSILTIEATMQALEGLIKNELIRRIEHGISARYETIN